MSFELIESIFQTVILFAMTVSAFVMSLIKKSRAVMLLSLGYGGFLAGILFYSLHIYILGYTPKIFYVAEISWLAAYLFIFSTLYLRFLKYAKPRFELKQAVISFIPALVSFAFKMFGPSYITAGAFSVLAGLITYYSLCGIKAKGRKNSRTETMLVVCIVLQLMLYIVSGFMVDETVFNPYYAVDMTFTVCLALLLPITCKEENHI